MLESLTIHPLAMLIPPMSADELEKLTTDIAANGLLEPIVLLDGQILDGRHRYQACLAAGVEPKFVEFTGADPIAFVLSKNLHRRHLTAAQKAAIAAEALPLLEEKAKERQLSSLKQFRESTTPATPVSQKIEQRDNGNKAAEQAAALTGTNRQYVADAKRIATEAPEVFDAMKAGIVSMPEAKALAAKPEPDREEILSSLPENVAEADRVSGELSAPKWHVMRYAGEHGL